MGNAGLDIDPSAAQFGARNRHVTASILDVHQYFDSSFFDIVMLNGVFGWGINSREDQDKALQCIREVLRPGGVLLLGWDTDRSEDTFVALAAAHGFSYRNPMGLPNRVQFKTSYHTYDLFIAN